MLVHAALTLGFLDPQFSNMSLASVLLDARLGALLLRNPSTNLGLVFGDLAFVVRSVLSNSNTLGLSCQALALFLLFSDFSFANRNSSFALCDFTLDEMSLLCSLAFLQLALINVDLMSVLSDGLFLART